MIRARFTKQFSGFELKMDLEAAPGVTVLFGPSGAGKTATLDCLAGFTKPDSGRILLNDRILFDAQAAVNIRPRQRNCGYVFQDHALFPHMTLSDNLAFAAERHPRLERHRRVSELLERFRISEFAHRLPHQVSGGQRQRCSIARALITEPGMLLLDEPARGLDAVLRRELFELAGAIRVQYKIPIVLVTHDLAECFALGDSVLILSSGKIAQHGSPREVYDKPATAEIARLLGIANLFEAEILALDPGRNTSRIRVLDQELAATYFPGRLLGDRIKISVPAHRLKLQDKPGLNRVAARLQRATDLPEGVRLEFEPGITVETSRDQFDEMKSSRQLYVEFPPAGLHATG